MIKKTKVLISGNNYSCLIYYSKRKTISLIVKSKNEIIVKAPWMIKDSFIHDFLDRNKIWLENKLRNLEISDRSLPEKYISGEKTLFLGKEYKIIINPSYKKDILIKNDEIMIRANEGYEAKLVLQNFYKKKSKEIFKERTLYWFPKIDKAYFPKIMIKKMSTRWGSMSTSKSMSLNIALIKESIKLIDYVIVHELCHIKHPHHKSTFWNHVASVMPDYKIWDNKLKHKSSNLL